MLQRAATAALQASSSHPPNASLLLLLPLSSAAVRILIVIWTTDLRFYLSALFFSCWATALIRCALRLRKQIFFFFFRTKRSEMIGGIYDQIPSSSHWKCGAAVVKSSGLYFYPSFPSTLNIRAAFPRAYYCVLSSSSDVDLKLLEGRRGMDSFTGKL